MISPLQPLSFDCESNDLGFCQQIDNTNLPQYQFPLYCDTELTGGLEKLPCENLSIIEDLSSVFNDSLSGLLVSNDKIEATGSDPHTVTAPDYVTAGKSYLVTMLIVNNTQGSWFIQVGDAVSSAQGNGVFSEIMNAGAGTDIKIYGTDGAGNLDGYVASVSIQCLRYSELYDIAGDDYTFQSPTKICKSAGSDLSLEMAIPSAIEGKTYKLSFKISGNTANTVPTEIGYCLACTGATSSIQIANDFFEIEVVCGPDPDKLLHIALPNTSDGCIEDITLYEKNEIRMGVYDKDHDPIDGESVTVEEQEDKYLATLSLANPGCKVLGYADLCSDYMGQFTGRNILSEAQARELINISLELGPYIFTVGTTAYVIYRNILTPGIVYDFTVSGFVVEDADVFNVTATAGGTAMTLTNPHTPPFLANTDYDFIFQGTAGTDNQDLIIQIDVSDTHAANGFMYLDAAVLNVNQDDPQFIPELFSECLNATDDIDACNLIEIKVKNDRAVFGINFSIQDYITMWLPAKFWHPKLNKEREVYENTTGNRRVNYSDTVETFTLTLGLLPDYLVKSLVLASDCDTFLINGTAYVCMSDAIEPGYDKSFSLAAAELEFVKQDVRYLKSFS